MHADDTGAPTSRGDGSGELNCKRCGHEWVSRITGKPVCCPRCKSPLWDNDYKRNIKKHTPEQVERIKKSILELTYTQPICIGKQNEIIIGTGRYLALKQIDQLMEVEVVDLSEYSAQKLRKLRILDNQLSLLGEWDKDNLTFELKTLYDDLEDGYEKILDDIGFSETFIDDLIRGDDKLDKKPKDSGPEKPGQVKHQYTCPSCGFLWTGEK